MFRPVSIFFTTILLAMSLFSLLGCFKKKPSEPKNIEDWLNVQWNGRFDVVATPTNFTDKEYYSGKRKSVIAESADPEVQFILNWIKGEKDLGVTRDMVEEAHTAAKSAVMLAREILQSLKQSDIESISVGVLDRYAFVFVFVEPTPEHRDQILQDMTEVLGLYREKESLGFILCFMEPSAFGSEFKDIIPEGHWVRLDSWQRSNEILRLSIPADQTFQSEQLKRQWYFNTNSDRLFVYMDRAYAEVLTWAKAKMPKGVKIHDRQGVEYWLDEDDGMRVHFSFPYFESEEISEEQERSGVVTGEYHVDKHTFTKINMVRDEQTNN